VLVAYWGVALEGSCGRILYEQPELHCRVRLRALFFAPSPGLTLGTCPPGPPGSVSLGFLTMLSAHACTVLCRDGVHCDDVQWVR
jgi:hypothetical protein